MRTHNHQVRIFRPEDLSSLVLPAWVRQSAWETYTQHPSFSVLCDGEWMASAGFLIPYSGLAEAWAILGPMVQEDPRHVMYFCRKTRRVMLQLVGDLSIRRLQATVMANQISSLSLIEHLGFKPEALLRKFGPKGEDAHIYVRFF